MWGPQSVGEARTASEVRDGVIEFIALVFDLNPDDVECWRVDRIARYDKYAKERVAARKRAARPRGR